jgi:dCMP deaminase
MSDINWTQYLFGFAEHAARKSKDSTKVGAVLVGPNSEVLLAAFNGPPMGVEDKPERFERPAKYYFASHAEQNLIAFAARRGIRTEGLTIYVTHAPCAGCAKSLIQAGIAHVIWGDGKTSMPEAEFEAANDMFAEAGVATGYFSHGAIDE